MGRSMLLMAFLLCASLAQQVNGQHVCLRLSYCASIEADLRGVKGAIAIKYKAAAEAVALYKSHMRSKNAAATKLCTDKLKTCLTSTSSLAVKNFKFPEKYRLCQYETYSKAIFGCRNIANWLPAVTNALPFRSMQCRTDCIVDEQKPVLLSNGKRLLDFKFPIQETELRALIAVGVKVEGRTVDSTRRIAKFYSTRPRKESEWGVLDTCQDGSWAYSTWICYSGDADWKMPNRLYFGCTKDGKEKNYIEFIDSTQDDSHDSHRNLTIPNRLLIDEPYTCGKGQDNSLIIGIQVFRRTSDGLIMRIDYLCAKESTFKPTKHRIEDMSLADSPIRLICEDGTAICSIQVIEHKVDVKKDLFADLRIGCCAGNSANRESFRNVMEQEFPGETPDFCHRTKSNSTCSACDKCQCCRIVDTVEVVTYNQTNFQFTPIVSRSTEHIILAAISQQLQPSRTTGLNWKIKVDESATVNEIYPILPPILSEGKFKYHYVWKKFTASCNGVQVVYYNQTIESTTCNYFDNCTTQVPRVCETLSDEWDLIGQHFSFGRSGDDVEWGPPYYQFEPIIDPTNATHTYIKAAFMNRLSKSPKTGFDWRMYFQTVEGGAPKDTYSVRLGEVPKGYFINIYQIKGTCDNYNVRLKSFKKVKFLYDQKHPDLKLAANCKIAKDNGVKLEKNDRCPK